MEGNLINNDLLVNDDIIKEKLFQVFQCLLIDGENQGEEALRNAEKFVITDREFESFLQRHSGVACLVPESNLKVCQLHFFKLLTKW